MLHKSLLVLLLISPAAAAADVQLAPPRDSFGDNTRVVALTEGDFDGDGDLDLAGAYWVAPQLLWWSNDGNGRWT